MCRALRTENVSNKIRAIKDSCSAVGLARSFARSQVRTRDSIWSGCRCRRDVSTHERARKRERGGQRAQRGRRRRRFGIYADRCPTVNRPIRRLHVRIAGQSRPLFFRRASLDRRLVFRILYYTVLPGLVSRLPAPLPRAEGPIRARPGPRGRGFTS